MRLKKRDLAATIALVLPLAGCSIPSKGPAPVAPQPSSSQQPSASVPVAPRTSSVGPAESVVGTVVRFTAGTDSVDVTVDQDNPATRDFLGILPLTLTLKEFNGREEIADLPRELNYEGSPGSDPEDGDLIYYTPWHNLGFYYNTAGIGYSEQTIHLGRYDATVQELGRFEGQKITVEIAAGP